MSSDPRRVLHLAALAVGLVWLPVILLWGTLPHALTFDDAWYYFEIGRNIAAGDGSTFDGTNDTNGYHPLWMAVVAGAYLVGLDDLAAVRALLVVQLALWVGALWIVGDVVARAVDRWPALHGRADEAAAARRGTLLVAVVLIAVGANPYILKLFVNGMETGLAALVGVALLALATTTAGDPLRRPVLAAALCVTAFLARTDAALLIAALLGWTVLLRRGVDRTVIAVGAAVAVVAAAYLATNVALVGHPMQISGVTKRADLDAGRALTAGLCLLGAAAVTAAGLRAARTPRMAKLPRTRAWWAATAWWPAGCLLLLAYEWGFTVEIYLWHYAPQVLWVAITFVLAGADIFEGAAVERPAEDQAGARRTLTVAALLALPVLAGGLWQLRSFVDPELRSMQLGDRRAGEWIAANLPADAVVGSSDAGVLGYFADRPVVNLDGLVNSFEWRDAREEGTPATAAFLREAGITHAANHGDPVDGELPRFLDVLDGLLGDGTADGAVAVHREDYVFAGAAGGRTGRRHYATVVYELP